MTAPVPRLRMFAGPNGSGKSTIKDMLPPQWLGVYVNADEIEKAIRSEGCLNLADFEVLAGAAELQAFLQASTLLAKAGLLPQAVAYADRAYIFDNSGSERVWIAEVTDGVEIEMKADEMPAWFKTALWDKFEPEDLAP